MAEPTPQTPWVDLIAHVAARERELELQSTNDVESEAFNPYWERSDVELLLCEISQRLLREIPEMDMEALGSAAVQFITPASGDVLPLNTLNVLGVTVQTDATVNKWFPSQWVSPESWFQTYTASAKRMLNRWTTFNGQFFYIGNAANVILLVEPDISVFQSDTLVLPPVGYDEIRVDWTHKILQVEDNMPGGRV